MSEPTEADRQKATTLYESMRGHTKMMNIESVWDAIAEARAEGHAAGREEAAKLLEQVARDDDESELGARAAEAFNTSDRREMNDRLRSWSAVLAEGIRALPDHPETNATRAPAKEE